MESPLWHADFLQQGRNGIYMYELDIRIYKVFVWYHFSLIIILI